MQFIACLTNAVAIVAVHHEDETLSVLEVVPPQRPDLQTYHTSITEAWGNNKETKRQPLQNNQRTLS